MCFFIETTILSDFQMCMFSYRNVAKLRFFSLDIKTIVAIFHLFFDSLPISCILCLVCHKRSNFLSFKGFSFQIYGLYIVFLLISW